MSSTDPAGIVVLMPNTVTDKGVFAVCKTVPIALLLPRLPSALLPG
ncbi:MAG: hypothetical protein ACREXS_12795 [Gammaproteobacteria bacterium]